MITENGFAVRIIIIIIIRVHGMQYILQKQKLASSIYAFNLVHLSFGRHVTKQNLDLIMFEIRAGNITGNNLILSGIFGTGL